MDILVFEGSGDDDGHITASSRGSEYDDIDTYLSIFFDEIILQR